MSIALNLAGDIVAPDYQSLISLISDYLDREDLNARIPAFIELASRRLNRTLFTADRETTANFVASGESFSFTFRVSKIKALLDLDGDDTPLEQITLDRLKRERERVHRPKRFAFTGQSLYFDPQPDSVTFQMIYEGEIALLSNINPTNWVLINHPDLYLYGALVQAEAYLHNDERIALWKDAFDEAIVEVKDADLRRKYAGSPLVMKAC